MNLDMWDLEIISKFGHFNHLNLVIISKFQF